MEKELSIKDKERMMIAKQFEELKHSAVRALVEVGIPEELATSRISDNFVASVIAKERMDKLCLIYVSCLGIRKCVEYARTQQSN